MKWAEPERPREELASPNCPPHTPPSLALDPWAEGLTTQLSREESAPSVLWRQERQSGPSSLVLSPTA